MTIDPTVAPGLLVLALELLALAAVGYVVARVALRQADDWLALSQGLVIAIPLWGLSLSYIFRVIPGIAGAIVSWALLLAVGLVLGWRDRSKLRLPLQTLVRFTAAALVLFWIALASRQLLNIPDHEIHLTLSSTIRAGIFPPTLSWNPDTTLAYHYGTDLLIAMLALPRSPDLAFSTELISAFFWTCFALVVVSILRSKSSSFSALVSIPLLLTPGAWTLVWYREAPAILQIPVLSGLSTSGLITNLFDIYWPPFTAPETWPIEASPPNIWKPPFILAYALALVVVERVTSPPKRGVLCHIVLAFVVGFMGLIEEAIALTTFGMWVLFVLLRIIKMRHRLSSRPASICSPLSGPALAAVLLATGGGVLTGFLIDAPRSSLSLGIRSHPDNHLLLGDLQPTAGPVSLLALGIVPVTTLAIALGFRIPLVVALAGSAVAFTIGALCFQHDAYPIDIFRLDGHARNFALLALLLAISARLSRLRSTWRYTVASCLSLLVTLPTIVTPLMNIAYSHSRGVDFANSQTRPQNQESRVDSFTISGRHSLAHFASPAITSFIQRHTRPDARILSPYPLAMSITTGRPNASGFANHLHLFAKTGPEFQDAIRFLEPTAVRQLRFEYVHATSDWVHGLPPRAQRWLQDPDLFEPLIRDESHVIYRVTRNFKSMDVKPTPNSFEALRQAVRPDSKVYLSADLLSLAETRIASALSHAKLLGSVHPGVIYLLTSIQTEPLGEHTPDVVVVSRDHPFDSGIGDYPILWWDDESVAYALTPGHRTLGVPLPRPNATFTLRLSDISRIGDRLMFTATFADEAPELWTGQDWLLISSDSLPWRFPTEEDGYTVKGIHWFPGQTVPSHEETSRRYEFNAHQTQLALHDEARGAVSLPSSGSLLGPGQWTLAVRLRQGHLDAAVIPVVEVRISDAGEITYTVQATERRAVVNACPVGVSHTDSCTHLRKIHPDRLPLESST